MTAPRPRAGEGPATAAGAGASDCIFVRDWVIDCNIGVYAEEKGVTQKVRLSIDAFLSPHVRAVRDEAEEVVSYTIIIDAVNEIASAGHINLVETFAERIAERCLADRRIASVLVRIEKLERGPVRGVEVTRSRPGAP